MKSILTITYYDDGTEETKLSEPEDTSDLSIKLLSIHSKMELQRKQILKNELLSKLEWLLK